MTDCTHDLAERETACADGMCPLCLARQVADMNAAISTANEARRDAWRLKERAETERDALRLELDSVRSSDWHKDAERYRWLRDCGNETWTAFVKRIVPRFDNKEANQIDEQIDACIAAQERPTASEP